MVNITIRPTEHLLEKLVEPTLRVRVWEGTTDTGTKVVALVALVGLTDHATEAEHAAFKAQLLDVDLQLVPVPEGGDPTKAYSV